jgi:hypothetical protein
MGFRVRKDAKIHNCHSPASFPGTLPGRGKAAGLPNMNKKVKGEHMEQDAFLQKGAIFAHLKSNSQ